VTVFVEFGPSGSTFAERIGDPEEIDAAVGRIAMNFSDLEDVISKGITRLLGVEAEAGEIVVAELRFKTKMHIFGSLFRKAVVGKKAKGGYDPIEHLEMLTAICFRSEELRNQTMHSSWVRGRSRERIDRRKATAKISKGLHVRTETVDSAHLLDIADYVAYAAYEADEFLFILDDLEDA
jgi:hypothetical protein